MKFTTALLTAAIATQGVAATQITAWTAMHDNNGGSNWNKCSGKRTDPCGCKKNTKLVNSCTGGVITALNMNAFGMTGTLDPAEISTIITGGATTVQLQDNNNLSHDGVCFDVPECHNDGVTCTLPSGWTLCAVTEAPTTSAPTTSAPTTSAPTTSAPTATTDAPTTSAPTTSAPTTGGSGSDTGAPTTSGATDMPTASTDAPSESTWEPTSSNYTVSPTPTEETGIPTMAPTAAGSRTPSPSAAVSVQPSSVMKIACALAVVVGLAF